MQHHAAAAELDGKQVLDFYWTDPIDAIKRFVAKRQYKNKLYTTFQPGASIFTRMIAPLTRPILEWYFKVHFLWIQEVLLCLHCFMQMPPFLDRACPIIPYTVRFFVFCLYQLCKLW